MRVKEHWENLQNLKPNSFMISHWMLNHPTSMVPPTFEFRIIGRYNDCLSRQIAEALFIEDRGNLNKKSEFTSNHICRLESGMSEWEKERQQEVESHEKANFVSNVNNFISVIKSVQSLAHEPDQLNLSHCRKRQQEPIFAGAPRSKIRRVMETSTPQWSAREPKKEIELSPISPTVSGGVVNKDLKDTSGEDSDQLVTTRLETGLSPGVRKILIKPKNESEFLEMRKLIIETINLTRAAMQRGLIEDDGISLQVDLEENWFNKKDRFSLSRMLMGLNLDDWEKDDIFTRFTCDESKQDRSSALLQVDELNEKSWEESNEKFRKQEEMNVIKQVDTSRLDANNEKEMTEALNAVDHTNEMNKHGETPLTQSLKRKSLSPYGETQVARALKLGKGNDGSPLLKERKKENKPHIPLASKTPGTAKKKRQYKRVKRCLNPDSNQPLLTSIFSPKINQDQGKSNGASHSKTGSVTTEKAGENENGSE